MKYILEFGRRGGLHVDNRILPNAKLARELAANLVMVFENDNMATGARPDHWIISKDKPRLSWQSPTHFVSISKLDGIPRGPASAGLWQDGTTSIFRGPY